MAIWAQLYETKLAIASPRKDPKSAPPKVIERAPVGAYQNPTILFSEGVTKNDQESLKK